VAQGPLTGTLRALGRGTAERLARGTLELFHPRVVGVTGSVGKTAAKEAVTAVLEGRHRVRASPEDGISLPRVVLGLTGPRRTRPFRRYPEWLVLEVGASRPGAMRARRRWLRLDVAVFTRVGARPPHLGAFSSRGRLLSEKGDLLSLLEDDGIVVVNADDEDLAEVVRQRAGGRRRLSYGFRPGVDVRALDVRVDYAGPEGGPSGMRFRIEMPGGSEEVRLPGVLGRPPVYAALAGAGVGVVAGSPPAEIADALSRQAFRPGRMRVLEGIQGAVVVDDTWNSSPVALDEALDLMSELVTRGRKVVVLGEMLGLGDVAEEAHADAARRAAAVADLLFLVGTRADAMSGTARAAGMDAGSVECLAAPVEAGDRLRAVLRPGDVVLVEGSAAGWGMEKAVQRLIRDPDRAGDLLARQGSAWR
jgi:UDP-N-acetylmuramoyl-tripeptide--D-alanyl-D-alanine ligase